MYLLMAQWNGGSLAKLRQLQAKYRKQLDKALKSSIILWQKRWVHCVKQALKICEVNYVDICEIQGWLQWGIDAKVAEK